MYNEKKITICETFAESTTVEEKNSNRWVSLVHGNCGQVQNELM